MKGDARHTSDHLTAHVWPGLHGVARSARRARQAFRILLAGTLTLVAAVTSLAPAYAETAVSLPDGSFTYERVDFVAVVDGARLPFERFYASDGPVTPALGPGWTDSFAWRLEGVGRASGSLTLTGPPRSSETLVRREDGTFTSSLTGRKTTLERRPDGAYVATLAIGTTLTFDQVGGLTSYQLADKPRFTIVQVAERTRAVVAPSGRHVFEFDEDPDTGRLLAATILPDLGLGVGQPQRIRFGYDAQGRLSSVIDREGQMTRYGYEAPDGQLLRTITDALGHVAITLDYDQEGRVVRQADARALQTGTAGTIAYSQLPDHTMQITERAVPSGWAPAWQPTFTHTFTGGQPKQMLFEMGPGDSPQDMRRYVNPRGEAADSIVGGETAWPSGPPVEAPAGTPGGAAVLVGDATQPLPTPACIQAPWTATAQEVRYSWATRTKALDVRMAAFEPLRQASLSATGLIQDGFGRLTGLREPNGFWKIDYDREDRVRRLTASPTGSEHEPRVVEIDYDAVGNVVEIREPESQVSHFAFDERASLAEARWPSGDVVDYEYDDRGDLLRARLVPADGGAERVADYAHDGAHRIRRYTRYLAWPDASAAAVTEYAYDAGQCSAYRPT
jgi:YD repeat-containing protein